MIQIPRFFSQVLMLLLLLMLSLSSRAEAPDLLLAKTYDKHADIKISDYWISEKYDGVRAYWDGEQLISRQGNVYYAPDWFTADFPKIPLDGELWIGRETFEALVSTVKKAEPVDAEWEKVRYMVFELPDGEGTFTQRLHCLEHILNLSDSPYIQLIKQFRLDNHEALIARLEDVTGQGAEGLMMHRADALYQTGRQGGLLKVKVYEDAEATVLEHLPGKGKFSGMLGSMWVETEAGQRFKIGAGFSNEERRNPPPIGALISYKYYGLTKNGKPRFASFLRVRDSK